jgi:hypothetical protein
MKRAGVQSEFDGRLIWRVSSLAEATAVRFPRQGASFCCSRQVILQRFKERINAHVLLKECIPNIRPSELLGSFHESSNRSYVQGPQKLKELLRGF